jgi:hypothetical protein
VGGGGCVFRSAGSGARLCSVRGRAREPPHLLVPYKVRLTARRNEMIPMATDLMKCLSGHSAKIKSLIPEGRDFSEIFRGDSRRSPRTRVKCDSKGSSKGFYYTGLAEVAGRLRGSEPRIALAHTRNLYFESFQEQ